MGNVDVETTGADIVKALGGNAGGKIILITGPSKDGIGAEITKTLGSASPSQLLLAGRNEAKVHPVIKEIQQAPPEADLTSSSITPGSWLSEVHGWGGEPTHKDEQWAKNVFLQEGRNYNPWNAYARTKTAGILFAVAIADNFGTKGVTSFAVDPGMVKGTYLLVSSGVDGDLIKQGMDMAVVRNGGNPLPPNPMVSIQQGVAGAVLVSLDASFGVKRYPAFVKECCVTPTLPYASDKDIANELWKLSEKWVGQTFSA